MSRKKQFFEEMKAYDKHKTPYYHKGHIFFLTRERKHEEVEAIKRVCKNE